MSFQVRDLMINVVKTGAQSGTALPADDGTPIPTPITPVPFRWHWWAMTPQDQPGGFDDPGGAEDQGGDAGG